MRLLRSALATAATLCAVTTGIVVAQNADLGTDSVRITQAHDAQDADLGTDSVRITSANDI
ncbi:hypothetical protein [Streptomyces sp. S.PB5]|uniref:hypothetical protein n=1 Tax=Streptomyces sp. S.PB5 TaxID=3020844 RepID=UPI0025B24472|nr:hypothetical protein [Streptomyces sp. S.PB5]MDN3027893.1 hypothetical protein [Streptomyces sp. S.PB5]